MPLRRPLSRVEARGARGSEQAQITLDSIGDAVLSTDIAGNVAYLNLAAEVMTGWSREAATGRPLRDVFHVVDRETRALVRDPLSQAVELNKTVNLAGNCLLVRRDGGETEIEDSAAPIRDRNGRVTGAVIVFRDVGTAVQTSRQMSRLAQRDAVTDLPNRLLLRDRLTEAIALARRHDKPLAVLFLDIDQFKGVNDRLGHTTGDRLLRSIALRLSDVLRQSDTVARYGGDEFVIVLSELERADDAALVARKLLRAAAAPHVVGALAVNVTCSVGVATHPDHGRDVDTLIANADAAMYEAKHTGPGNYRFFDLRMHARVS